jgi:hypothetical protein
MVEGKMQSLLSIESPGSVSSQIRNRAPGSPKFEGGTLFSDEVLPTPSNRIRVTSLGYLIFGRILWVILIEAIS